MASDREPNPTKRTGGRPRQGVVALSSAAVLAIYSAGYAATSGAARRFDEQDAARAKVRPAVVAFTPITPGPAAPLPPVPRSPKANLPPPVASPHESSSIAPALPAVVATPAAPVPATDLTATALVAPVAAAAPVVAAEPVAPAPAAVTPAVTPYKDGTYSGWGSSRHGDIQAEVVISQGRIASARIQQCLTRYSCSWIAALPGQVVSRQSANVDYISGATQSSDAFYYAIAEALKAAVAP